jgi:hypothetical protein
MNGLAEIVDMLNTYLTDHNIDPHDSVSVNINAAIMHLYLASYDMNNYKPEDRMVLRLPDDDDF